MKPCSKCGISKELDDFPFDSHNKDGRGSQCRICKSEVRRRWERRRSAAMPKYEDTIGSSDEFMAYEAFVRLNCKTDEDYAKPEFQIEAFREQVKTWVEARRKLGRPVIYTV